jgi:hypothetical protein
MTGEPKQQVAFEAVQKKDGRGWYVRALLPRPRQPMIYGFFTEAEARAWIGHKSGDWLKRYEGGKYADST